MEIIAIGLALVSLVAAAWYRIASAVPKLSTSAKGAAGGRVENTGIFSYLAGLPPRELMMVLISIVVLASALFIILTDKYDAGSQKWAFSAVGSITGFWLRPGR